MNILKLEARNRIYKTVKTKPGICVRELQRETGFAIGQLTYHLSLIIKADLMKETLDKRFRRFYSMEINEFEMKILSLLRQNNIKKIIELLLVRGNITNKELSEELKISKSTMSWYFQNLEAFGLLKKQRRGKRVYYSLKNREGLLYVITKYKESFTDNSSTFVPNSLLTKVI